MAGAATLVSRAALRAGAGYVRQSSPGVAAASADPVEAVHTELPGSGWASAVLGELDRFGALVIGNGLGTGDAPSRPRSARSSARPTASPWSSTPTA